MERKITVHTYRNETDLDGWDSNRLSSDDYDTERARRLYAALNTPKYDEESVLAAHDDGRWALFGLTTEGHSYAAEEMTLLEAIENTLEVKIVNTPYFPEIEHNWREGMNLVVYGDPNEFWAETVNSNTREAAIDLLDTIAQECWHCDWPTDDPNYVAFLVDIDGDAIQLTGESHSVTPIGITSGF
jgi:hypothetical protein